MQRVRDARHCSWMEIDILEQCMFDNEIVGVQTNELQSDHESSKRTEGMAFHTQSGMSTDGANEVKKFRRRRWGQARHRAIWALVIETQHVCVCVYAWPFVIDENGLTL